MTLRDLPEAAARDACGALLRPLRDVTVLLDGNDLEATPGDRLCVVGTLKATLRPAARAGGAMACVLAVVACSVTRLRRRPTPGDLPAFVDAATAARVRQRAAGPDPLGLLAASLAPELGAGAHAWPRRALVLQLAGTPRYCAGRAASFGCMHCLLLDGPPAARAALLRAAAAAAPHAFVARATTLADAFGGFSWWPTVRRDDETGGWALHAGGLVLADCGVACMDGLEALDAASCGIALCEVLEHQSISVARAGIHETMHARCALLAAAGGAYDASRSVAANLAALPATLIERFHLAFVLCQEPPPAEERAATEGTAADGGGAQQPAPLSAAMLRAHITMARAHRLPELTSETGEYIMDRYKALRQAHASAEAEPPASIGTLETMICLAEAHARLRLGDTLLPADVDVALEVMHAAVASGGRWAGSRPALP